MATILFQRGAVNGRSYLGSLSRARVDLRSLHQSWTADFRKHIAAPSIAQARVNMRRMMAQGHSDLGTALGLDASYMATVDGKMMAGFRRARCFDEHERVLELDARRHDAALSVGMYR